jgi:hypothetical protein
MAAPLAPTLLVLSLWLCPQMALAPLGQVLLVLVQHVCDAQPAMVATFTLSHIALQATDKAQGTTKAKVRGF